VKATAALIVLTAVSLLLVASVACGDDDEDLEDGATPTQSPRPEAEEFELTAEDFSFTPDTIELGLGESLDINLNNDGDAAHTFTLDELHIDVEVPAGESVTVPLTASAEGEYNFYCKFHDAQGMVGALRVGVPDLDESGPTETPSGEESSGDAGY
jgi:plastocyanin